jgi:ABC-type phosphate/phosphonate transport system permease subunit
MQVRIGGYIKPVSTTQTQGETMELEVTWGRAVKVWWAYLWRNLLAIVAMMVLGTALGFVIGLALGALGLSASTTRVIAAAFGAVLGLALSVIPIKLILGKDFGSFRLVLMSKD